jgi:hypothetical protein
MRPPATVWSAALLKPVFLVAIFFVMLRFRNRRVSGLVYLRHQTQGAAPSFLTFAEFDFAWPAQGCYLQPMQHQLLEVKAATSSLLLSVSHVACFASYPSCVYCNDYATCKGEEILETCCCSSFALTGHGTCNSLGQCQCFQGFQLPLCDKCTNQGNYYNYVRATHYS